MYDVEKLFVEKESLQERGLSVDDLLVDIEVVERAAINDLVSSQDVVMSF